MADHHHADHVHGSMDIRAQEKTFAGFIRLSIWVACIAIGVLIFMGLANS
ncbi:MAG: aa3-type cytochrome c oxidase subunit IV [Rhodobacterales bacterium]|nr:aa3-type cytochrome c oxidase subunit IV [Rhodobacterales bacterium]